MNQTHTPSDNPKLDALLAEYLEAVERGEQPDRAQVIAANPDLAAELQAFFSDLDRVHRAAATPADPAHAPTVIRPNTDPIPGVIIGGRYKLLENIGEGGMGSVWVAEQQRPLKRKVAIKLIKPGMDSKQVLARFEAERQALAVMDHPNIAKVFDGGLTDNGRPYFVMEYVKGVPFTDYCDRARLPLKDRLTLFIAVCSAVQHAHQKGIIHRDLKPSNILICLYDGHPVPKVIDFGLAKAMHQPLTDQSIYTGHGVMVGTPLYMSPEQAESNNLDIDTRTDIYSLGVVLYELLTGSTPLERQQLKNAAFEEMLRLIKEVEPPRPSLRLSGSDSLPSIAAQRSIDPKQLSRSLAGDLDWIVMKTLDKERSRRYETANGLARDIERFLNEEAVEACPPSTAYRVKKFVKRHKAQVTAAGLILLALIAGIIGTTWGLGKAKIAEEKAITSEGKTIKALADVTKERDAKEEQRLKAESATQSESEQRAKAERVLLTGILRTIGFSDTPEAAELKALADWSALGDSRLQILALELAFEDPATALRIARRAERVIQASVGLSPKRRAKALELTSAKQRDLTADPRIRVAACWLALELGSTDLPAIEEGVTYLSGLNSEVHTEFEEFVQFAVERSSPEQAVDVTRKLIAALGKSTNKNLLTTIAYHMESLAPRLNPEQISLAGDSLIQILEQTTDEDLLSSAAKGIVALATKLSTEQVNHLCEALASRVRRETISNDVWNVLVAFSPRLNAEQINIVWDALIGVLEKSPDKYLTKAAGECLVALAPRLSAEQVTRGGEVLITALDKSTDDYLTRVAGECLVALAPRLSAEQVTLGWDAMIVVLEKSRIADLRWEVVNCLVELAPKLNAEQVTRGWDAMIGVLEKSSDAYLTQAAGECLVALAPRLSDEQVTRAGDRLIGVSEKSTDANFTAAAGECLVALAPRLSAEQVIRVWDVLISVLKKSADEDLTMAAGDCLAGLASRMSAEQVTRAGDTLIGVLEKSTDYSLARAAGESLVALAPRLDAEEFDHLVDALVRILDNSSDRFEIKAAGNILNASPPNRKRGIRR